MPPEPSEPARFESLRFETEGGVARITLHRPEAANAIDLALARELMHAAILCDEAPDVRAVLLSGRGRFFCSGGDVASFEVTEPGLADAFDAVVGAKSTDADSTRAESSDPDSTDAESTTRAGDDAVATDGGERA